MLARFKMPLPALRKAIETLDESILTADNLGNHPTQIMQAIA